MKNTNIILLYILLISQNVKQAENNMVQMFIDI